MKKNSLLLISLLLLFPLPFLRAQEMATMTVPYRQVIITEHRAGDNATNYTELTNVGDSSVNMNDFYLLHLWTNGQIVSTVERDDEGNILNAYYVIPTGGAGNIVSDAHYARLPDHILAPGESFTIINVYDGTLADGRTRQRPQMVEAADMYVHLPEPASDSTIWMYSYPELQNFDFDSVSVHNQLNRNSTHGRTLLHHRIYGDVYDADLDQTVKGVVDSVLIDGINLIFGEGGGGSTIVRNIAGVSEALTNHIIVRKNSVTHGNLNWDQSAGVSTEDSEWIVIPKFTGRDVWTTIGTHGNYTVSATSEILTIDLQSEFIIAPWGIYKGDSIIHQMEIGPGMAWTFEENSENFEGLGHSIVQNGDTLILYATGDELDVKKMRIQTLDPAADETRIFPKRVLNYPGGVPTWGGLAYSVKFFPNVIDTVTDIPYATRVDTLLKYLEKPENASWEIVWGDGRPRADLKHGDILRVTAENGANVRNFFLDVQPFAPSTNANLASITWPEKPGFLLGWRQDTIPGFASVTRNYDILLPFQFTDVPALQVTTQNPNASVKMFPALSIDGTRENRTTRIQITAQDDSTIANYNVTFQREKPSFMVQSFEAEPFFSQFLGNQNAWNSYLELYNPGTEPIDLSNYMLISVNNTNPAEAIQGVMPTIANNYNNRYHSGSAYIPGFKWPGTQDEYNLNPGKVIFDAVTDPILMPGETWYFASGWNGPNVPAIANANVVLGNNASRWGDEVFNNRCMLEFPRFANRSVYLFKILNDSIQQGLKAIEDPADFELIEFMGYNTSDSWDIAGRNIGRVSMYTLIRKPHVLTPGTEFQRGWGTSAEDSDWILLLNGDQHEGMTIGIGNIDFDIGRHTADEATFYRSTVSSNLYKVDDGYMGNLHIRGVSSGETVEAFFNNLIKADEGQVLEVSATAGGSVKELNEVVAEGDLLTVTSADAENQTVYNISVVPLDGNNTLLLATGSNLSISREGNTGIISGFQFGATISNIFEQVVKPATATLRIINEAGELLPMTVVNMDTVKVSKLVGFDMYFEVTAENGDAAVYHLQPSSLASDAFVLSDQYIVSQEESTINLVTGGTAVSAFLANLTPVAGATMVVRDKNGLEREYGAVRFDDFLYVTSEDKNVTKIYFIQFINDPEGKKAPIRTNAPDISNLALENVSSDGTQASLAWDFEFGLELGFVIERDGAAIDTVYTNAFTDEGLTKGASYNYTVYAFNEFGNSAAQTIGVVTWPTGVDQTGANAISIYPNVTTDMVYFRNLPEGSRVALTDLSGRSILLKNAVDLKEGLSLQSYANGYYLIRVIKGQEYVQTVRVLKK